MTLVSVQKLLDSNSALTPTDGDVIFNAIRVPLNEKKKVILDFNEINIVTTAFLNAAIGQLYSVFSSDTLNEFLKIQNLSQANFPLLIKVITRAKEYFNDKKGFESAIDQNMSDD